jgi:4-amino-4-deoxy-L-arabinose transferase-like glycosyltransferase
VNLTPRQAALRDTLALVTIALLPRLFVAIAWAREPVWDGHYYHFGAARIAEGLGYSEDVDVAGQLEWRPWTHYPVGYSGLLGGFYFVFGPSIRIAPLLNAVIGALTAAVGHRVALHWLTPRRALVAGALIALHPGLIAYSSVVMTEPLAALLLIGALWARVAPQRTWVAVSSAGALLGAAALVRPSSLVALPLLLLVESKTNLKALLRVAAAGAIALAVVTPWTVRNCLRMDGCALVSTNGGWNLAIGALTDSGRFRTLRADDGCPIVTGQVQQDRCWAEVGLDVIRRDPLRWLGLAPRKLSQTYDHESFAIEYLREADPKAWPESRRIAARELLTLFHRLLLVAASLAVVALVGWSRRQRTVYVVQTGLLVAAFGGAAYAFAAVEHPFFWFAVVPPLVALLPLPGAPQKGKVGSFLLGLVAAASLTHVVFFGDDRYHVVVTPALCLLAAAALRAPFTRREQAAEPAREVANSAGHAGFAAG